MALHTVRFLSTARRYHSSALISIRGGFYVANEFSVTVLSPKITATFSSPQHCVRNSRFPISDQFYVSSRNFSSTGNDDTTNKPSKEESHDHNQLLVDQPILVYEGPFASLTLKLKRISLTSAVIGIVGLPLLSFFYGAGTVPATGQLAVIATAGVTAVGSTALLGYCFSPYVHTLERLPGLASDTSSDDNSHDGDDATKGGVNDRQSQNLVRIITRDILARKVETVFDPKTDVSPPPSSTSRPFCNFMVKGLPMYVHPELIHDYKLRLQLVGEESKDSGATNKMKVDDDEFL